MPKNTHGYRICHRNMININLYPLTSLWSWYLDRYFIKKPGIKSARQWFQKIFIHGKFYLKAKNFINLERKKITTLKGRWTFFIFLFLHKFSWHKEFRLRKMRISISLLRTFTAVINTHNPWQFGTSLTECIINMSTLLLTCLITRLPDPLNVEK